MASCSFEPGVRSEEELKGSAAGDAGKPSSADLGGIAASVGVSPDDTRPTSELPSSSGGQAGSSAGQAGADSVSPEEGGAGGALLPGEGEPTEGGAKGAAGQPEAESAGQAGAGGVSDAGAHAGGADAGAMATGDAGAGGSDTETCPAEAAVCEGLRQALVHRYGFQGTGTVVTDSVSGQNGEVIGAELSGTGTLTLAGGSSDGYVDLPNGIVSALTDATFELWFTWHGGDVWQRIFDFGSSDGGEGVQGTGASYIYLTPKSGATQGTLSVTYSFDGPGGTVGLYTSDPLPSDQLVHLVVVVDSEQNTLSLYLDGVLVGSADPAPILSSIVDNNNWLGRSQFSSIEELAGTYEEFRIYDTALTATQVATSFAAGTDPEFLAD